MHRSWIECWIDVQSVWEELAVPSGPRDIVEADILLDCVEHWQQSVGIRWCASR